MSQTGDVLARIVALLEKAGIPQVTRKTRAFSVEEFARRKPQGILELKGHELDFEYIERWIRDLALEEEWRSVQPAGDGEQK